MLTQLFANENTKNFKRLFLWVELLIIAGLAAGFQLVLYVIMASNSLSGADVPEAARLEMLQTLTWPLSLIQSLSFAASNALGGLMVIVFVSAITAQEYTWRTLHLWLSQGVRRPVLMVAKFGALLLPIALIVLVPLIAGGAITAVFTIQQTGSLNVEQLNAGQLFLSYLRTTYTLLPYAALAFFLAVISRSPVVAIGVGLAYAVLIEGIVMQMLMLVGGRLAQVSAYLPGGLSQGLLALNQASANVTVGMSAPSGVAYMPPVAAVVAIAAWTLAFLGLAMWTFQRQDLSQ